MTAAYWASPGRTKMCSMSKAIAASGDRPARSGNAATTSRSSKSASAGSGTWVAPVAATTSANRAPVRKLTVSPRATRWAATGSSGATCPWTGTAAMRW